MARGRGRPRLVVDLDEVRELASEGNTQEDIARVLGFSASTFKKRKDINQAYKQGMAELRTSLRHWQVAAAKSGNVQMLVWLGKILLGQKEDLANRPEIEVEDDPITKALKEKYGDDIK